MPQVRVRDSAGGDSDARFQCDEVPTVWRNFSTRQDTLNVRVYSSRIVLRVGRLFTGIC